MPQNVKKPFVGGAHKKPMVDIRDLWMRVLDERVSAVEAEVNRRMRERADGEKDASKTK